MNVKARAEAVATFRFVNVFLMEVLAAWVPSTPEMEAKVLFGRHLWLIAQSADRLGRRTRELRAPLHSSRPPTAAFLEALNALAALKQTGARIESFYQIALSALESGYSLYVARTDKLIDEPTLVICEAALCEIARMKTESTCLFDEFPMLRAPATDDLGRVGRAFAEATNFIEHSA